uniref:Uncharacterized protein n=1 Tax=Piliocolobus tephrosceles TaxID=591936 RepID=A0A8C9IRH7_9PRIM
MQEGQCLCTGKSPLVLLLPIPCAHTPSQHALGVPQPGHPRWPSLPPTTPRPLPNVFPGRLRGLENFSKLGENPPSLCRRRGSVTRSGGARGPPTFLQPQPLRRGAGSFSSHLGQVSPQPPAPRGLSLSPAPQGRVPGGARGSGSPYLSASPAAGSWGPCGWSAFSPGRSAACSPPGRQAGAGWGGRGEPGSRLLSPRALAGSARPGQVRKGSGSLA